MMKRLMVVLAILALSLCLIGPAFAAGEKVHYLVDLLADGSITTEGGHLVLGKSETATGDIKFYNSTNTNTATIQGGVTTATYTLILPVALGSSGDVLKLGTAGQLEFGSAGSQYWSRADTTISPATANDSLDMGTGTISGGKLVNGGDLEMDEGSKVILNSDDATHPKETYIVANADDTVSFFRNNVEYMRFE